MSGLYDSDIVAWSAQQAERLGRLARGERVNDVDWINVVEEIDSLGRSETNAVRSLLVRALEHWLKAAAWPQADPARKWQHDAASFLRDARRTWTPAMAARIDLPALYADALVEVRDLAFAEGPPGPLPEACPASLAELMTGEIGTIAGRFRS